MASKVSARNYQNTAPYDFSPYNTLTVNMILPFLDPNSAPALVHTFSQCGAVINAFCI